MKEGGRSTGCFAYRDMHLCMHLLCAEADLIPRQDAEQRCR